jgi:hypothetical protein
MRLTRNPFMVEGARIYFSQPPFLLSYLGLAGLAGLTLFLSWPRVSFASVLGADAYPGTFTGVAICLYLCLTYLGARYGSEGFSSEARVQLRDYVLLTPVSLASIVAGKALFAFLHTAFLLALGAPFLLASLAVSGGGPSLLFPALAVIGGATFAVRMFGFFALVLMESSQFARNVCLTAGVILFLLVTALVLPAANPIAAILSILPRDRVPAGPITLPFGSIPFFSLSAIMSLLAGLGLAGGALVWLGGVRRRARTHKGGTH